MNATEKRRPRFQRRIYLMRHADVSYFDADGKPFRPNTVPLNAEGRTQAQAAARELADIPFDRVVTSDLIRSVETATIILGARSIAIETNPELREIQPGRLADIPPDALERTFCDAFGTGLTADSRFLAGEAVGHFTSRVLPVFQSLLADPRWHHLLIVAHGGVNRVLLAHALGSSLPAIGCLEQDPCCLNIIDVDSNRQMLVRLVNHTAYNPAKIGIEQTTMERIFEEYTRRR